MNALATYILAASMLADPCLPTTHYGDTLRDDHGGFLIVGEMWFGVGRVLPGGRAVHVVWTQRRNGHESCAYPAVYSWDAIAC